MFLIDTTKFHEFLELGKVTITPVEVNDVQKLLYRLNVLFTLVPDLKDSEMFGQEKVITLDLGGVAETTLTPTEFLEKVPMTWVDIPSEAFCTIQGRTGLFYHPLAQTVLYVHPDGTLLNAMAEPVAFEVSTGDMKSLYHSKLSEYMPAVDKMLKEVLKVRKASWKVRGFGRAPKAGDKVRVLPYERLKDLYGENTTKLQTPFINAMSPTYGIGFLQPCSDICGLEATIVSIDNEGLVTLVGNTPGLFGRSEVTAIDLEGEEVVFSVYLHEQILEFVQETEHESI